MMATDPDNRAAGVRQSYIPAFHNGAGAISMLPQICEAEQDSRSSAADMNIAHDTLFNDDLLDLPESTTDMLFYESFMEGDAGPAGSRLI